VHNKWLGAALVIAAACGGKAVIDANTGTGGASGATTATSAAGTDTASGTSATSSGSGAGFNSCSGAGQCVLAWPGCCSGCTKPELDDLVAIHRDQGGAFFDAECPNPQGCPLCEACPNGNLFAFCDDGTCRGADLRQHPASECSVASDCVLRAGTGCCETCDSIDISCGGLVAIHKDKRDQLTSLVCEQNNAACPPCAPNYPANAFADCNNGRCEVVISNQ